MYGGGGYNVTYRHIVHGGVDDHHQHHHHRWKRLIFFITTIIIVSGVAVTPSVEN